MSNPEKEKCTEAIFSRFTPMSPGPSADQRILDLARQSTARPCFRKRLLCGAGVAAAACCLALLTWFACRHWLGGPGGGRLPVAPDKAPVTAVDTSDVPMDPLAVLTRFRGDCQDVQTMLEAVPEENKSKKEAIAEKLSRCLEKIALLEERVRFSKKRSAVPGHLSEEVNV